MAKKRVAKKSAKKASKKSAKRTTKKTAKKSTKAEKDRYKKLQAQAKKKLEMMKKKFKQTELKAKDLIKENPEKAVLIAGAVGAAIGTGVTAAIRMSRKKK
jgi:ElaB/YqjD/DUF883 family membrane-anchored ribosome-binding protein